jgi:hypothetical protein
VFKGTLLLRDNTKPANYTYYMNSYSNEQPNITKSMEDAPHYGAGILAENTNLSVEGTLSLLRNNPGAVWLKSSTAVFSKTVAARNNQDAKGVFALEDTPATFKGSFSCRQDVKSYALPGQRALQSETCIRAQRSSLHFEGPLMVTNSYQGPCNYEGAWGQCEDHGGAAISCEASDIRFKGRAQFAGNAYARSADFGAGPELVLGGGAWRLQNCSVVAEQWVGFRGNAAQLEVYSDGWFGSNKGGAVCALMNSSLVFQAGLELTNNNASLGGGVFLSDSHMQLTGGKFVCKGNVATDGECVSLAGDSKWNQP